jgi:hypothetical protein
MFHKYKCAETTNSVEGLHSVRRKWMDKRLQFKQSYKVRANMSILSKYIDNWIELVLKEMKLPVEKSVYDYMKVRNRMLKH